MTIDWKSGVAKDSALSEDLREAEKFFEWALSYEQKGLKIAADALRDEGRKSFARYLATANIANLLAG